MVVADHVQAKLRGLCGLPLGLDAAVREFQDPPLHCGIDGQHAFDEACFETDAALQDAAKLRGVIVDDTTAVLRSFQKAQLLGSKSRIDRHPCTSTNDSGLSSKICFQDPACAAGIIGGYFLGTYIH